MALRHASPGERIDVRPFGAELSNQRTTALFKAEDLEVLRLVLPAGKSLPPHQVAGEITIHCLEGAIVVSAQDHSHVLRAGELLYLAGGVMHGVTALEDASALVTLALKNGSAAPP
jgi:quercetin dioxygenase-like cupin family protein